MYTAWTAESVDFAHFKNFLLEELNSGQFCWILADSMAKSAEPAKESVLSAV